MGPPSLAVAEHPAKPAASAKTQPNRVAYPILPLPMFRTVRPRDLRDP
jgi:hypothetical protein